MDRKSVEKKHGLNNCTLWKAKGEYIKYNWTLNWWSVHGGCHESDWLIDWLRSCEVIKMYINWTHTYGWDCTLNYRFEFEEKKRYWKRTTKMIWRWTLMIHDWVGSVCMYMGRIWELRRKGMWNGCTWRVNGLLRNMKWCWFEMITCMKVVIKTISSDEKYLL